MLPTALDYAGISVPAAYRLDGTSFLPLLKGESDGDAERMLFWACDARAPYPDSYPDWRPEFKQLAESKPGKGIREIPRKERHPPGWYVLTPRWKLIGWGEIAPALIDRAQDPYEHQDVSAQHPEIVASLRREFDTWILSQKPPQNYSRKQWQRMLPAAVETKDDVHATDD